MTREYVIDGYNLLHAIGILRGRVGPQGLEKARGRLLGLLKGSYGDEADHVTVVFDAGGAPPDAAAESTYQGIRVHYAVGEPEADDVIEELIRRHSAPKQLTVVSSDRRLQSAARRRGCTVRGCWAYMEELLERRRVRRPQQAPEKAADSDLDKERWLAEFADLDQDAAMKELFDPFGFSNGDG